MSRAQGMRISFALWLAWAVASSSVLWAAGAYPTWRLAGGKGLAAQTTAGAVVLTVMTASAAIVRVSSSAGPSGAALGFLAFSMVRVLLCAGAAVGARAALDLPVRVLFVWMCLFYLTMLSVEGVWLTRALMRDCFLVDLDGIERPKQAAASKLNSETDKDFPC